MFEDYDCHLSYHSGNDESSYYAMECEGTQRRHVSSPSEPSAPPANPIQAPSEIDDTFNVDSVVYECSLNYGKILENLGQTLKAMESKDKISIDLEASRIREQFQKCKMNLLESAARRFGSLDRVSSVDVHTERINILENGEVYLTVKMSCSERQ